jgi:hypothetical protein
VKKSVVILLLITLTWVAFGSFAQTKGNFSDWNVPPPLPPGTTQAKDGADGNKISLASLLTDLPPLAQPAIEDIIPGPLPPVLTFSPIVATPDQPLFPDVNDKLPDMPMPDVPDAPAMPQHTPADLVTEVNTDLPAVESPGLPAFPKIPAATVDKPADKRYPLPLMPAVVTAPVPKISSSMAFPYTGWFVPPVPSNVHFTFVLPPNPGNTKPSTKKTKKAKKNV